MSSRIDFETPENVHVAYRTAGVGTRFVAWFVDQIILTLACFVITIGGLIAGAALGLTIDGLLTPDADPTEAVFELQMVIMGLATLVWSLGGLFYFGLSELFMGGQTFGKRRLRIRVVKADGFALDPTGVLIRTIFRLVDQIPLLWIVPVMSARSQRFGDMAARTVVVADGELEIGEMRQSLAGRSAAESRYKFDASMLKRARPQDFQAVEELLERWGGVAPAMRESLAGKMIAALSARMQCEAPPTADRHRFLEDLLAAEFRRQNRALG